KYSPRRDRASTRGAPGIPPLPGPNTRRVLRLLSWSGAAPGAAAVSRSLGGLLPRPGVHLDGGLRGGFGARTAGQGLHLGLGQAGGVLAALGVVGQARAGRDEAADDHVLLEPAQSVARAADGRLGEHPGGLL